MDVEQINNNFERSETYFWRASSALLYLQQFDMVMEALDQGKPVDLSSMPPPPPSLCASGLAASGSVWERMRHNMHSSVCVHAFYPWICVHGFFGGVMWLVATVCYCLNVESLTWNRNIPCTRGQSSKVCSSRDRRKGQHSLRGNRTASRTYWRGWALGMSKFIVSHYEALWVWTFKNFFFLEVQSNSFHFW